MVRRILFTSVGLAPLVVLIHYAFHPSATARLRPRGHGADPARVADRRSDRACGRAHRPGDRRLPQRDVRERAGVDHRALRRSGDGVRGRARVADRVGRRQPAARARLLAALRRPRRDRPAVELPRARTRRRERPAPADPVDPGLGRRSRARRVGEALDPGLDRPAGRVRDSDRVLAPQACSPAHRQRRGDQRLVAAARARSCSESRPSSLRSSRRSSSARSTSSRRTRV